MMLAHTRLLVPKTLPIRREAESSAARVVMPEMKTVKYKYFFMDARVYEMRYYTVNKYEPCYCETALPWKPVHSDLLKIDIQESIFIFSCALQYGKLTIGNVVDNKKMKRILCIEDEPEMIDLIRLILGRRGFEVLGAAGGMAGLKEVREQLPDLVLLDLMMPDMDGWEVYQQMKADDSTRNIPVIVVTAKAQSIDKVLGLHIAKVDDYIAKPFSPQDLLNSVEKVLSQKKAAA